jgi:hypothetical protein
MSPAVGFVGFLTLTLALLGGVFLTGFRAQRRVHLTLVVAVLIALGATIWHAEELGELYDLEAAGTIYPVHLALAKTATLAYALPLATGAATLRRPALRRWHRRAAFTVLALTFVTAITGTWMLLAAEPL